MFKRYEVVLVYENTTDVKNKYRKYDDAYDEAESINKGRERLGLFKTAYVRRNGHFVHRARSQS